MIESNGSSSTESPAHPTASVGDVENVRYSSPNSYWVSHESASSQTNVSIAPAYVCYAPSTGSAFASALARWAVIADVHAQSSAAASKSVALAALALAYDLESGKLSRQAAKQLMRFVETNARMHEWQATNRLLVELDTDKLSSKALTGVVRATARTQHILPGWKKAYKRAWDAIEKQGKDPSAMFVGMERPVVGDAVAPPAS